MKKKTTKKQCISKVINLQEKKPEWKLGDTNNIIVTLVSTAMKFLFLNPEVILKVIILNERSFT